MENFISMGAETGRVSPGKETGLHWVGWKVPVPPHLVFLFVQVWSTGNLDSKGGTVQGASPNPSSARGFLAVF